MTMSRLPIRESVNTHISRYINLCNRKAYVFKVFAMYERPTGKLFGHIAYLHELETDFRIQYYIDPNACYYLYSMARMSRTIYGNHLLAKKIAPLKFELYWDSTVN